MGGALRKGKVLGLGWTGMWNVWYCVVAATLVSLPFLSTLHSSQIMGTIWVDSNTTTVLVWYRYRVAAVLPYQYR